MFPYRAEHPLAAFDKLDQFKLFVFDTGLLKHMAGIDNSAILLKTDFQFKGPLTENYVLQQLRGQFEVEPRYYSDKNSEIDFLIQHGTEIIPIEAKGGEDCSIVQKIHCRPSSRTRAAVFQAWLSERRCNYKLTAVSGAENKILALNAHFEIWG